MNSFSRVVCILLFAVAIALLGGCAPKPNATTPPVTPVKPKSPVWFEDAAAASGVDFKLGHNGKTPLNLLEILGTGCAACDLDGDGHPDLFLVGQTGASEGGKCCIYRNKGTGEFEDVTAGSGLDAPGMYMGCAVGDFDNDGLPDLLVTGYGVVRLYKNLGHFKFKDITKGSGLEAPSPDSWATSAAFFDYDRDGLLDIYICRYVIFNSKTIQLCDYGPHKGACGPRFYDPQFGSLYRNIGKGVFKDVTRETGLQAVKGKCLGIAVTDVNGDGWPDFYLANDEMPGDLLINEKGKHFKNIGVEAGVALAADGTLQGGMGVDFADVYRQGNMDLFVTTFENEADSLYRYVGKELYQNESVAMSLDFPTRRMVGFGAKFIDTQNRGWVDILVANGNIHDNQEIIDALSHFHQPVQLFINDDGKKFTDQTASLGPEASNLAAGRGLAVADFNGDGLQDSVIMDIDGKTKLLMNRFPTPGAWLRVRLHGHKSNSQGLGARVKVTAGSDHWVADCTTAGSYLSANDPTLHFGLGRHSTVDRIEVQWPSGKTSVLKAQKAGVTVTIEETQ